MAGPGVGTAPPLTELRGNATVTLLAKYWD